MAFLAPTAEKAVAGRVAKRAAAGAGKKAGKPGPLRHQPNNLNDLPADWHAEELDIRKQDAAWAAAERKAGRDPDRSSLSGDPDPSPEQSAAPSPSGGLLGDVRLPSAGGGLVLGAFVYVLGLTYLRSGPAGVKAWLRAKFLNDTSSGGGAVGRTLRDGPAPYVRPKTSTARSPVYGGGGPGQAAI